MRSRHVPLALLLVLGSCAVSASPQSPPKTADNRIDEAVKLLGAGRLGEAIAAFNSLKQSAPNDPRPYFYAGIALAEAGRLSAGALELSEAVRIALGVARRLERHAPWLLRMLRGTVTRVLKR